MSTQDSRGGPGRNNPDAAGLSPGEIVARLHREIASMSPEHAALVAAFEQIPRRPARPLREPRRPASCSGPRLKRLTVYSALRLSGASGKAAARKAGVSQRSGQQYEADFLGVMGGAVRD